MTMLAWLAAENVESTLGVLAGAIAGVAIWFATVGVWGVIADKIEEKGQVRLCLC